MESLGLYTHLSAAATPASRSTPKDKDGLLKAIENGLDDQDLQKSLGEATAPQKNLTIEQQKLEKILQFHVTLQSTASGASQAKKMTVADALKDLATPRNSLFGAGKIPNSFALAITMILMKVLNKQPTANTTGNIAAVLGIEKFGTLGDTDNSQPANIAHGLLYKIHDKVTTDGEYASWFNNLRGINFAVTQPNPNNNKAIISVGGGCFSKRRHCDWTDPIKKQHAPSGGTASNQQPLLPSKQTTPQTQSDKPPLQFELELQIVKRATTANRRYNAIN